MITRKIIDSVCGLSVSIVTYGTPQVTSLELVQLGLEPELGKILSIAGEMEDAEADVFIDRLDDEGIGDNILKRMGKHTNPDEDEGEEYLRQLKVLLSRNRKINILERCLEDFEDGDPQRIELAEERLTAIRPDVASAPDPEFILMPEQVDDIEDLSPHREGHPATGTIFDTWFKAGPGEQVIILGQPNAGKSASLVDVTCGYAQSNEGVVIYFSEEMARPEVFGRMSRRICGNTKDEKVISRKWRKIPGSIWIESHPSGTSSVEFLMSRAKKVVDKTGQKPIAIVIDYIGQMHVADRRYDALNSHVIGIRAMGEKLGCPTWTACQPQRSPSKEVFAHKVTEGYVPPVLGMADVSECWAIPQTADFMVSINQTQDEKESDPAQVRLHCCKMRVKEEWTSKQLTVASSVNYATCQFV